MSGTRPVETCPGSDPGHVLGAGDAARALPAIVPTGHDRGLTPLRPRAVFCPILDRHRSRTVADDACAGRFTLCGLSLELGPEPDWLDGDFPADEEWRIEWSKFSWGLDLANAFAATGEARYVRAWESLVGSWIEEVPVNRDATEVSARRLLFWIYAWSAFAGAPEFAGFRAGFERDLVRSIDAQARYVREGLTPERNHRTIELHALFAVAIALPGLDPDGELLRFATAELEENLRTDFRADGVHREASTHYHLVVLRSFLAVRETARVAGLALAPDFDELLSRACDFALHVHRPDGAIPALSDADTGSYPEVLGLAATLLGRPDLRWAATAGTAGEPPRERYVSFPSGGYHVQRSGWGERRPYRDERFLVFDCGPLGDGGHGHYDLLSVELAAGGRPLLVDPGRGTYAEGRPNLRHWFKGTAAHNTVCVDGLDQTPYRRGKPRGPVAAGRFLGRLSAPGLDLLHGEATSPAYDAVHRRRVVFVADEYWLLEDVLSGSEPHRYDLRFHLAPGSPVTLVAREDERVTVRADGLVLSVCPAPAVKVEPGRVAPEYGRMLRADVVSVVAEGADASFVTLAAPVARGEPSPLVRVHAPGEIEVRGLRCTDRVFWSAVPRELSLGPVRCRAAAAWLRCDADGEPLHVRACGVVWAEAERRVEHVPWFAWDAS